MAEVLTQPIAQPTTTSDAEKAMPPPPTSSSTTTPTPTMTFIPKAERFSKPPLIANDNAFLGDIATSSSTPSASVDTAKPLTCGVFRLEKGAPLHYTYTYDEMKMILEGSFDITDEASGRRVRAEPGDVFFFPNGVKIKFETEELGVAFYTGRRAWGEA